MPARPRTPGERPVRLGNIDVEELTRRAEEALYTAVGLGILGFQHLQVRRRELARSLEDIVRQVTDPRPGAGPSS